MSAESTTPDLTFRIAFGRAETLSPPPRTELLYVARRSGVVPEAASLDHVDEGADVCRRFAFGFSGFFFESFFAHALTFFVFPFDPAEVVVDHKAFAYAERVFRADFDRFEFGFKRRYRLCFFGGDGLSAPVERADSRPDFG